MAEIFRQPFREELEQVKAGIVRMAGLVAEAIPRCTEALLLGDLTAARELVEANSEVDNASLELEHKCHQLLALQQPTAGDLRGLLAALVINYEIQRSGGLVVNITKSMRRIYPVELGPRMRGVVTQMGEESRRLFQFAIDAYAESNAGLAAALDDIDDRLDRLNHQCLALIISTEGTERVERSKGIQLALIARYYERIGDHAVNIGGRVRYMVDAWRPSQEENPDEEQGEHAEE